MSELIKCLIAARKEMGSAKKTMTNPHFKSKYADLAAVIDAVKEPLEAHSLSFLQTIKDGCVVTVILHEGGETLDLAPFPILATNNGPQGYASGTTYARRQSLSTALGVPQADDDANSAQEQPQKKFPSPVASSLEGVQVDREKVGNIAKALVEFHGLSESGEDVLPSPGYKAFELLEPLDSDEKLAVWSELAQHSKVRSWLKKVSAEHRTANAN